MREEAVSRPQALITEIQRFSIHDGPGIRTTVFLKGCPLRCEWCHNPECISFETQEMLYPQKCIGCGKCSEGCYSGARVQCGRLMSTDEVLDEVMRDAAYYGSDGGITVSGGEPLAHRDFVLELLQKCRRAGVGTAMESSMYRFDAEILSLLDVLMTDIKILDSEMHKRYTGIGNEEIIENIRRADEMGVPIIVRTPVITGVNDSDDNIMQTAALLRQMKNVIRYELLAYHPLGISKAEALGTKQKQFSAPTKQRLGELQKYAEL